MSEDCGRKRQASHVSAPQDSLLLGVWFCCGVERSLKKSMLACSL